MLHQELCCKVNQGDRPTLLEPMSCRPTRESSNAVRMAEDLVPLGPARGDSHGSRVVECRRQEVWPGQGRLHSPVLAVPIGVPDQCIEEEIVGEGIDGCLSVESSSGRPQLPKDRQDVPAGVPGAVTGLGIEVVVNSTDIGGAIDESMMAIFDDILRDTSLSAPKATKLDVSCWNAEHLSDQ